jgi:hypothetical protein
LRGDPTFQTIVGKADPLASQPTLSRLENQADWPTIERLGAVGLQWFLQHGYPKRATPEEILLDSDATDDPCHGQQEFAFFHGKYGEHMYHPLFFFEAKTGCLLSALLRPGNASASAGIADELKRLVPILKRRFPKSQLSYRADAGSATPEIYRTLESFDMLYAIGIASNSVFKKRTQRWLNQAKRKYARTKIPIRLFYSFRHRAGSWNKRRRIVVKIEVGPLGTNVRFVITNRPGRAEQIYDGYDDRGECENRIKEFKRDLSADRLSCHSYRANAFRLQLHALAYQLLVLFRRHALRTTDFAHLGWKPYGSSCSKLGLALSAPLATCGFISPQAGRGAICSLRSGKTLRAYSSLPPVNLRSLQLHRRSGYRQSEQTDAGVFFENAFSLSLNRQIGNVDARGLHELQQLPSV